MAFLVNGSLVVNDQRSVDALGISTFVDISTGDISASGIGTVGELRLGAETAGYNGVSIDLDADAAATKFASAAAIKTYVDAEITATGGTLNFAGDSGTGNVDISDGTLSVLGTTNQIVVTAADAVDDGSVTSALSGTLQLPGTLAFGAGQAVGQIVTVGDTIVGNINDTSIPTSAAVNQAIADAASGGGSAAATVNLTEDAATNSDFVIPFADPAGGDGQKALNYDSTDLLFNPSTGRLNAQEFNALSDIRYKENVKAIESPMDKVNSLSGVTYDWKSNGNSSAGVIAQEVQEVMPYLVSEGEDKMTVNYNGLVGLLVEAVKELSAEVAALKAAK